MAGDDTIAALRAALHVSPDNLPLVMHLLITHKSLPVGICSVNGRGGVKHSSLEAATCPGPTMNSNMFLWATSA